MEGKDLDPARLRVSDRDRHQVAEILRRAAGDGRIDFAELDQRLEIAFTAKTYADLVPLTTDLPEHPGTLTPTVPSPLVVPSPTKRTERHFAVLSGFERKGVWTMPEQMYVLGILGGGSIDLRRATFGAKECVITLNLLLGGLEITVGPGVRVVMEGGGFLGGSSNVEDDGSVGPDSPILRIRGVWVLGGLGVVRKPLELDA